LQSRLTSLKKSLSKTEERSILRCGAALVIFVRI
jgi:hypothetical protein